MNLEQLKPEQSTADVSLCTESVTLLCACGCGASLAGKRGHAKTATPACRKRLSRAKTEHAQVAVDALLRKENEIRAFSTFGKHDPLTQIRRRTPQRKRDTGYQPCSGGPTGFSTTITAVDEYGIERVLPLRSNQEKIEQRYAQPVNPQSPIVIDPRLEGRFIPKRPRRKAGAR